MSVTLVLGGARSGKSRHAESLIAAIKGPRHYIATAQAFDDEMLDRIQRHKAQRGEGWQTHEVPLDVTAVLNGIHDGSVLIDCITIWISNLMHEGRDVEAAVEALCGALTAHSSPIVIVSNEVGLSVVPENALARAFRDHQGRANQRLAQIADDVIFVAAGLPLSLKTRPQRRSSGPRAGSGRGRRA